jgi:hypothetical protein
MIYELRVYRVVQGRMAYQDMYRLLCWMAMGMVACAFLLSTNRPGRS